MRPHLPEPRPIRLRSLAQPDWNSLAEPRLSARDVRVGDVLPGGSVVVKLTWEAGVEQVWLRFPGRRP